MVLFDNFNNAQGNGFLNISSYDAQFYSGLSDKQIRCAKETGFNLQDIYQGDAATSTMGLHRAEFNKCMSTGPDHPENTPKKIKIAIIAGLALAAAITIAWLVKK